MGERGNLLASIAKTIADYREGDLAAPTPKHVERWISQFNPEVELPILREMDHALKKTYFSRANTRIFLGTLFRTERLVGADAPGFWRGVKFLDIQGGGASQKEMLALFSNILQSECGFGTADCGAEPHAFVYLDDAIFTGNRVARDLQQWVAKGAPDEAIVHVVTIALHAGAKYYAEGKIKDAAKAAGKSVKLAWWRAIQPEDRKLYTANSDVLRPTAIPDDEVTKAYVEGMRYPPHLRTPGSVGGMAIFSSDEGRQLLEQEFLKTGVRIRKMCPKLGDTQRPLGHMTLDTLGFGSLIVTFRNCPNNAPLALWVDAPWYPLFQRTTNSDTSMKHFMAMLAKDVSA